MSRTVAVQFADMTFASKSSATEFFKRILSSGQQISESEYPVVLDLFKQYLPSYNITDVSIEINTEDGAPHRAYRVSYIRDGQVCREFKSYKKAINGCNRRAEITKQLRKAVMEQTMAYKKAHYGRGHANVCQCCHCQLNKTNPPEVDHYPVPFCDIVSEFMHSHDLSYDTITADEKGKNISPSILSDFSAYHNARAQYRLTCQECNVRSFRKPNYLKKDAYFDSDGEEII